MIAFVKTLFWNALCWEEMLSWNEPKVKTGKLVLKKEKKEKKKMLKCFNV